MTGVEKLLEKEGGSTSAIAAKLSDPARTCSRQLVEYWRGQGYVTGKWAPVVNRVYGIPLHELNPLIYPQTAA
jgi:hypothetical protein